MQDRGSLVTEHSGAIQVGPSAMSKAPTVLMLSVFICCINMTCSLSTLRTRCSKESSSKHYTVMSYSQGYLATT